MTLVDKVKEATADIVKRRSDDRELRELTDFYRAMQQSGVAVKRTYDIPPIDTIGRTAYNSR